MGAQEGLRHAAAKEAQGQMKLLTETEAATVLKCSTTTVKRLRRSGRLTYVVGRPVLIDEADLQAFIDAEAAKKAKKSQAIGQAQRVTIEEARKWARITILLGRAPPRSKI